MLSHHGPLKFLADCPKEGVHRSNAGEGLPICVALTCPNPVADYDQGYRASAFPSRVDCPGVTEVNT